MMRPNHPLRKKCRYIRSIHRFRIEVSLGILTPQRAKTLRLPLCLHPLCRDLKVQASSKTDHGSDNGLISSILLQVHDEAAINFDMIDRKLLEMSERRIARPEVIESNENTLLMKLLQGCGCHFRAPAKQHSLGDFNLEVLDRYALLGEKSQNVICKI